MLHQSHTMVVDHQKEEEYRRNKENFKEGEIEKWQDIKTNNAVFVVEKDKSYS